MRQRSQWRHRLLVEKEEGRFRDAEAMVAFASEVLASRIKAAPGGKSRLQSRVTIAFTHKT